MDKTTTIILSVFGAIFVCLFIVPFVLWVIEVMWRRRYRRMTKRYRSMDNNKEDLK